MRILQVNTCIIEFRYELSLFVVPTPQAYVSTQAFLGATIVLATTGLQRCNRTIYIDITSEAIFRYVKKISGLIFGIVSIDALNRIRLLASRNVTVKK